MGANPESGSPRFRRGGRARINRGQFEGYEAEVVAVDEPGGSVQVVLRVFGRPVPLSFSFAEAVDLLETLSSDLGEQEDRADRPGE
jgi:transcription antitermination factor NusG